MGVLRSPPHLSEPCVQQAARSWQGARPRRGGGVSVIGTLRGQLQAGMGPAAPKASGEGLALLTAHGPQQKPHAHTHT